MIRQREPRLELPKLTRLAEGKPCMVHSPICNGRTDTTVWAHSNQLRHGKAVGGKAHDCFGAFACQPCHDWLDNKYPHAAHEDKVAAFERARDRTEYYLWANNLLKVAA